MHLGIMSLTRYSDRALDAIRLAVFGYLVVFLTILCPEYRGNSTDSGIRRECEILRVVGFLQLDHYPSTFIGYI